MADTSKRGFGSVDDEKQREIASEGGKAAHEQGAAHEFSSSEAREAGRKGGEAVSEDREHMAEIGQKGGEARQGSGGGNSGGSSNRSTGASSGDTRGGTSEQHLEAGHQSHKNS
jgi:general stress protein YciG